MNRKNSSIVNRFTPGFGILITMLLILIAVAALSFARMQDTLRWRQHTYDVLVETHSMATSLFNLDTAAHEYVMTNDPQFLGPLHPEKNRHWRHTKHLTADNPAQQERLQKLHEAYQHWLHAAR